MMNFNDNYSETSSSDSDGECRSIAKNDHGLAFTSTNSSSEQSDVSEPPPLKRRKHSVTEDDTNRDRPTSFYNSPPARNTDEKSAAVPTQDQSMEQLRKLGNYSSIATNLMAKMGYRAGTGLGKVSQGRVDIVPASKQRGRRGLGLRIKALDQEVIVNWEDEKEPSCEEQVEWMPPYTKGIPERSDMEEWLTVSKKKLEIENETLFCNKTKLLTVLKCKTVFDDLEGQEMMHARRRSNPYETIRGTIFLNRAAMKMANMDYCFNRIFSSPPGLSDNELLYFADVCAGPGGFSEYVLWKRKWRAKGFGFTLKGDNDFKLNDFFASNQEQFEPHYGDGGIHGDGDVTKSDNLEEFQNFVLANTDEKGVHFVMADGGFSVAGQENLQEILTKQLLLCQFACALSILCLRGSFVCKTFDLFTPFSVGLIHLLRIAFERVCVFKPVTSRPANSERYVVCTGYRDGERRVYEYLMFVNDTMNDLKSNEPHDDVNHVVPLELLLEDDPAFRAYITNSNERIADEQCKALAKIHAFSKDRTLLERRQTDIRQSCLRLWQVPDDQVRTAPAKTDPCTLFHRLTSLSDPGHLTGGAELKSDNLEPLLSRIYNYRCYVSGAVSSSGLLVCLGGHHIFLWNARARKWSPLTEVQCQIPRNTILEVEIVQELKGEGKGQHRKNALHIVDALVLSGEDITQRNYTERMHFAWMFAKSISKPSCPHLSTIRTKDIYRFEEISHLFGKISMRKMKGAGSSDPRPCYILTPAGDQSFHPTGVVFVKICQDPWSVEFSKSQKRKYFYSAATNQSSFDCPQDFNAAYGTCARTRVRWSWTDAGMQVHHSQPHKRPELVSSERILQFVRDRSVSFAPNVK